MDIFGDFGDPGVLKVIRSMDKAMESFKYIACLVDLDENEDIKITVTILSWSYVSIISDTVARRLVELATLALETYYEFHRIENDKIVIKKV